MLEARKCLLGFPASYSFTHIFIKEVIPHKVSHLIENSLLPFLSPDHGFQFAYPIVDMSFAIVKRKQTKPEEFKRGVSSQLEILIEIDHN